MLNNYKLIIAYDGAAYLGWQKTREGRSIEGTLQTVLEQILQTPVKLQSASRTDAGVHASGQVVNFFSKKKPKRISINRLLPDDIVALELTLADPSFHPSIDAVMKEYHYWICNGQVQLPKHRHTSWHVPRPLDVEAMRLAASFLVGVHDFAAFTNLPQENTVRSVDSLDIEEVEGRFFVRVRGKRFMYKMVRNLVGHLVTAGSGKLSSKELELLKTRAEGALTAPAHGLTLYQVEYD